MEKKHNPGDVFMMQANDICPDALAAVLDKLVKSMGGDWTHETLKTNKDFAAGVCFGLMMMVQPNFEVFSFNGGEDAHQHITSEKFGAVLIFAIQDIVKAHTDAKADIFREPVQTKH